MKESPTLSSGFLLSSPGSSIASILFECFSGILAYFFAK